MFEVIIMLLLTIFIFDIGRMVGKLGVKQTIEEFREAIFGK